MGWNNAPVFARSQKKNQQEQATAKKIQINGKLMKSMAAGRWETGNGKAKC